MRGKEKTAALVIAFCLMVLAGCRDEPTAPDTTPSNLQILSDSNAIFIRQSLQLKAEATLLDGSVKDVTSEAVWSIAPGIAGQIDENGKVTASAGIAGDEQVTAEFEGQTTSVTIRIVPRVRSLAIIPLQPTISMEERIDFQAFLSFENQTYERATDKVAWSVSPPGAGEIDASGRFRPLAGPGASVTVKATYQAEPPGASTDMDSASVRVVGTVEEAVSDFTMTEIPGGSFVMGDDGGKEDEKPEHSVLIDPFFLSRYEVTVLQYVEFLNLALARNDLFVEAEVVYGRKGRFPQQIYVVLGSSPNFPEIYILFRDGAFEPVPGYEELPVVKLSWYGCVAFCDYYGLRLPTEAEWEKAARGGSQLDYGTSDGSGSQDLANYRGMQGNDGFEGLATGGAFPANPYGLYDMSGNAGEFVFDTYSASFYENSPGSNPTGPGPEIPFGTVSGSVVWRGGSWIHASEFGRAAFRGQVRPTPDIAAAEGMLGFRVARSIP